MYVVYTYDNLEAVAAVLNGVASIMGSSAAGYSAMIKTIGTMGFLVAVTSFLVNPTRMAAISWLGGFVFVYVLLFLPVTRVNIVDVVRLGQARTVDNVPAALALTASVSSTVGFKLTRVFERVMQALPLVTGDDKQDKALTCGTSTADTCGFRFSQGGMLFANKLLVRIESLAREGAAATDPKLETDMYEFLSQCTAYDLTQKLIKYDVISKSTDLWADIKNTSPARYVMEKDRFKPCPEAWNSLDARRQAVGEKLEKVLGRAMFPHLGDADAKRRLNNSYKDVAAATNVGDAAWDVKHFLLQNMVINQAKRGLGRMGMESGSPSAIMLGQAESSTVASTNASFVTQSRLAEEALPLIRNGIETILYGIFPIVVLIMMVQTGPALVTAIKGFVFAFIWIQLWPPLFALVNYIGQVRSLQSLKMIVNAMRGAPSESVGVAFANYNNIYNGQLSDQAVMGYLIIAVPVIASSIIYGMNSAMSALGGGTFLSGAGRSAEAVGSGNVSMANVSMGQQTLGPSRVDADVFSHTGRGGSFKYGLTEPGLEYLGGQFNATQAPFKLGVRTENVSSLKEEYAEKAEELRKESTQLSNSISSTFAQNLASNKEFAKFVEGKTGYSLGHSGSTTQSTSTGDTVNAIGGSIATSTNQGSSGQSVQNQQTVGLGGFGNSAGKTEAELAGSSEGVTKGHASAVTGQKKLSADEELALMQAYDFKRDRTKGDRETVTGSAGTQLNFQQAAQRMDVLSDEVSKAEVKSASLSKLDSRKTTIDEDLVTRATQGLNDEKGATYVAGLTGDEKRRQVTQWAVDNVLIGEYGLSRQDASRLLDTSGGHFRRSNVNVADPAGLGLAPSTPDAFFKDHKSDVYTHGVNPGMKASNADVPGNVQNQLETKEFGGIAGQIASQSGAIKGSTGASILASDQAISSSGTRIKEANQTLSNGSALGTVGKGMVNAYDETVSGVDEAARAAGIHDKKTLNELGGTLKNLTTKDPEKK